MGIKVEGHTHLIRDEESHAIINTDVEQYRLTTVSYTHLTLPTILRV